MTTRRARDGDPVGVILVGCGYIAQAEHIPGWMQEPQAGIVAVVDRDASVAAGVGLSLGVPSFTELGPALAAAERAVVHVCTPAATHHDIIAEALEAGRHVLAEKPLTSDSGSAQRLCDLAERTGLTLMTAAPRLFDPYVGRLTDAIDRGEVGTISLVSTVWRMCVPAQYQALTTHPRHHRVTARPGSVEWLRQRLLDESIHHLGVAARWSAGPLQPRSVSLTDRAYHIVLHSGDGVVVTHTNVTPSGHGETFAVYGDQGRFEATPWSPHFPSVGGAITVESADGAVTHPAVARVNPYWLQLREFVDVVRGVRVPRRPARAAVDDLRTIEAIVEHAHAHRPATATIAGPP